MNDNLQLLAVNSKVNHQPNSFRGLTATTVHKNILNLLPPPSPSLPGGDLSLPLQHCRETGGCSELTYLMAQECWLAASVPPSILLAQETSLAHPIFPLSFTLISSFQRYNHPRLTIIFPPTHKSQFRPHFSLAASGIKLRVYKAFIYVYRNLLTLGHKSLPSPYGLKIRVLG